MFHAMTHFCRGGFTLLVVLGCSVECDLGEEESPSNMRVPGLTDVEQTHLVGRVVPNSERECVHILLLGVTIWQPGSVWNIGWEEEM